jgi:CP family cyanate transporter-like MFS transporter
MTHATSDAPDASASASASARRSGPDPALVVVIAGVAAALHIGKLPPALPVLQQALGLTLVQSGFLVSLVQMAGMVLGLSVGLAGDTLGHRRCMLAGLLTLSAASVAGGFSQGAAGLLVLRAVEGVGFLLAVTPGPSLVRRVAPGQGIDARLGLWGAYMPTGTALALLAGPWVLPRAGWPAWWWLLAGITLAVAAWLWRAVPSDPPAPGSAARGGDGLRARARRTLGAPGPWLLGLSFACYAGQWLAVIGFLPTVYAQAQVPAATAGLLTALAAAVNMVGNIGAGRLLRRGVAPAVLLRVGFVAMGLGAVFTFLPALDSGPVGRYLAVLLFSLVGGLVPATLFALCLRLAPDSRTVATTVGWMQQCSAIGQFLMPPLVGWMAKVSGGWQWTWVATGAACVGGLWLSGRIARRV